MKFSSALKYNMPHKDDTILLRHIIDAAAEISEYVKNRSRQDLDKDRMLQHSLIRCLEVIGEAASKISESFRDQHADYPWREMIVMRNRLIHAYFDINLDIVWKTCSLEIPELVEKLAKIP
jgi:uncharacterized protein with HEPN domain